MIVWIGGTWRPIYVSIWAFTCSACMCVCVIVCVCVICYDVEREFKMLHKSNGTLYGIHTRTHVSIFSLNKTHHFIGICCGQMRLLLLFRFPLFVWVNTYLWWYYGRWSCTENRAILLFKSFLIMRHILHLCIEL